MENQARLSVVLVVVPHVLVVVGMPEIAETTSRDVAYCPEDVVLLVLEPKTSKGVIPLKDMSVA